MHRDGGGLVNFFVLANSKLTGFTAVSYFFTLIREEPIKRPEYSGLCAYWGIHGRAPTVAEVRPFGLLAIAEGAQFTQGGFHTRTIGWICLGAVVDMALLDEVWGIAHGPCGVVEQRLLLFRSHQAEQVAGLLEVVVIIFPEVPPIGVAVDLQGRLPELGLLLPLMEAVGLVVGQAAVVAIGPALTIAVVAVHRAACGVHRDLLVVHTQTVALRVGVVEQAGLQHLVWGDTNAGHQVAGGEGALLHIGEEVFRVKIGRASCR